MTFEGVGKKEMSVKRQGQWDFVDATVLGTCLEKERRERVGLHFYMFASLHSPSQRSVP